ncbi:MAG: hypothetical protein IJD53_02230 [Alistipes sp.]|nr:hypothetical protein [Alistipes sp.]
MKMLNIKYTALFAAVALMGIACDKEEPAPAVPVHEFKVEGVEITPTERSAEVEMEMPYYSVDGVKVENTTPSVEYRLDPSKEGTMKYDWTEVKEYNTVGDKITFSLNNLVPGSHYELRVALEAGEYGKQLSDVYTFQTVDAPYIFEPTTTVTAYGYYAHCSLDNAILYIDGKKMSFTKFYIEYKSEGNEEALREEYDGSAIRNGVISVSLPQSTSRHLEPETNYECRVIAVLDDVEYESYTRFNFTTVEADIEALFGAMKARVGGGLLIATLTESLVKVDTHYTSTNHRQEILYRQKGSEEWSAIEVTAHDDHGKIEASIDIDELLAATTYETCARISLYGNEYYSKVAEVTTPESDEIVVPTPPVGGDTSMMAGTWHLTEWRGSEPSFDIYMVITETGGITLWQRLEDCEWELYQSAAETANGIISGTYTDGIAWGADYYYSVPDNSMTWTDTEDSADISVYERSSLPDELANLKQAVATRGISAKRFL